MRCRLAPGKLNGCLSISRQPARIVFEQRFRIVRFLSAAAWRGPYRTRLLALMTPIGAMCLVEIADWFLPGTLLSFGIRPREWRSLPGVLWAPLLHRDIGHLLANVLPLAILGAVVLLNGVRQFAELSAAVALVGGLGAWACGENGTVHVGASGLVFGYFGFLVARGFFHRSPGAVSTALAVGVLYSGLLWGVLPLRDDVSWLGHLFSLAGGAVCARLMRMPSVAKIDQPA